jgi:DNA-binding MarR family transcriptional regulator
LLERRESAADRRLIEHRVTDRGRDAVSSLKREAHEFIERITAQMDPGERVDLARGLRAFERASGELGIHAFSAEPLQAVAAGNDR